MYYSVLNIAYSDIGFAPWNTVEHYQLAAHLGFNAIKGDIQVTSDGGLVMCHDCGFTFDRDGRITQFDPTNFTLIADLKFSECMELEYAEYFDTLGHYAKVASYDDLVRICHNEEKYCYTTVRDRSVNELVSGVLQTLEKYHMTNKTIINSFTYETLQAFRKKHPTVVLSQVRPPQEVLTRDIIDHVAELGHSMVCMFSYDPYSFESPVAYEEALLASADAVAYAASIEMPIYQAQVYDPAHREQLLINGFSGFQITHPMMNYDQHDYQFRIRYNADTHTANIYNAFNLAVYTAELVVDKNQIFVRNIGRSGSLASKDNYLPTLWLNTLPYQKSIWESNGAECSLSVKDGVFCISADLDYDRDFLINIHI